MSYSDDESKVYDGYVILDGKGDAVYTETGDKSAEYYGNALFIENDFTGVEANSAVFTLKDGKKEFFSLEVTPYYILDTSEVVTVNDEGRLGLVDISGGQIIANEFEYIMRTDGYYIGYLSYDPVSFSFVDSVIFDLDGQEIYRSEFDIWYFNGIISVECNQGLDFMMYDSMGGVVCSGQTYYEEGGFHIFSFLDEDGAEWDGYVANSNGEVVGSGITYVTVDATNNTFIGRTSSGAWKRFNAAGEAVETYNYDYVCAVSNGIILVANETSDGSLDNCRLVYNGKEITKNHGKFDYWEMTEYITLCVASDYNLETDEYTYTYYIVNNTPFSDVSYDHWAFSYISDCNSSGLMNGTGNGAFSPNMQVSRAQVVTTLWRLAGSPAPDGENKFVDVPEDQWYTDAVTWAAENGITGGVGGSYFAPDRAVTRGEVAAIIYRFAGVMGRDTSAKADISAFPDTVELTDWNRDAFAWCVQSGIITGKTSAEGAILASTDVLTRAEIAAVLCRY